MYNIFVLNYDMIKDIYIYIYNIYRVNKQLPLEIVIFINYPLKSTKLQLPPWNCTTLINLPPPSNSFVSQHDVLQILPWSFALMCKMPFELENLYVFFLSLTQKILNQTVNN